MASEPELETLLAEVRGLSALQRAKVAAIMGALVADAAVQPIHWIYNPDVMDNAVSHCPDSPEFLPISANAYYTIPTGCQSPYGDQLLTTLKSLVTCKGFDAEYMAKMIFHDFGPGSPYENNELAKMYKPGTRSKSLFYPMEGKWQNYLLRRFCECYSHGIKLEDMQEDDTSMDPDNLIRNIPLVALLAGDPTMLETLHESVLQIQTNDMMIAVVMAGSRLIERCILDSVSPRGEGTEASCYPVQRVIQDLKCMDRACPDVLDLAMASHLRKVLDCRTLDHHMPGSVQSAIHALLDTSADFVTSVRRVALVGGCNCSRVGLVGACLGAKFGMEGIPVEWLRKTYAAKKSLSQAIQLVQLPSCK